MSRSGVVTILHSVGESVDSGLNPIAPLVQGDDGALYGVTVFGGVNGHGTAFRVVPDQAQARKDRRGR